MAHPKGGYRIDGKRVPGVTTITGRFKDSGGLLYWAFEQGKAAERGEIDKLYDKRDAAGESGTLAHSMVETHIKGEKFEHCADTPISTITEAEHAFKAYLSWAKMTKLKIVEQEMPMVSERYQFGGCPDAIGKIDRQLCLVDWKTSSGIYTDYLVQIAAYKILWEENNPKRPLKGGFHLCRFSKQHGDFAHHYFPELPTAERQFLRFREAYEDDKELKARAK